MTNKILIDPNHQRFFKQDDLMDLFSYNDDSNVEHKKSMTGKILKNMDMDIEINKEDITKMEKELDKKEKKEEEARQIKESHELEITLEQQQQQQKEQQQQQLQNNEEEKVSPIKEYPQKLYDSPMSYNSPMNNTDNSDSTYNETSVSSSATNNTNKKKKKRYSYNTVDNDIKQSKYSKVRNQFLTDDDHQQRIKKEIDNIEGIEYTEDFKVPTKTGDEENSEEEDNDLFTQSEDKDSDAGPKKKKSRKGKEKIVDDNENGDDDYADEFNDMDLEKEDKDKTDEYQSKDELRILKNLMNITGAVSVIEHDKIMDSKKWSDIRDDKEAEKIANNAVKKLRKFMERRRHVDISIPTWTGR